MIDLRSDTVTLPSPEMRLAMAEAELGDDVFGEDPQVNKLQTLAASLFNKEAALFVPSGTMANLIAFLCQTRPGDSVILSAESHPYHYEGANMAAVGGLLGRPVHDPLGKIDVLALEEHAVLIDDPHFSRTTLLSIENTTNRGGGNFYRLAEMQALRASALSLGMKIHCDGARIFDALTASGDDAISMGDTVDTLSFCLSKGLGCPAGSLLLGTRACIAQALRHRKMLGGGMRQAGVLAAAGLYALEHHIPDLRHVHAQAAHFRDALEAQGAVFSLPSPTNILYLAVDNAVMTAAALAEKGIKVLPHGATHIRVVFHRDLQDVDVEEAIAGFQQVLIQ